MLPSWHVNALTRCPHVPQVDDEDAVDDDDGTPTVIKLHGPGGGHPPAMPMTSPGPKPVTSPGLA